MALDPTSANANEPQRLLHISSTDGQISFSSDHHMHHALAKALNRGEPSLLTPSDIPVFSANEQGVKGSTRDVWTVEAIDERKSERLWLLTEPFGKWDMGNGHQHQLQLVTSSKDQGWIPMKNPLSFEGSWFEFGIRCPNKDISGVSVRSGEHVVDSDPFLAGDVGKPKFDTTTGSELRWHSHNNLLFGLDFIETEGKILQKNHEIWRYLGPDDRVAVYMCAQSKGRKNHCIGGSVRRFKLQSRPALPKKLVQKILQMARLKAPKPRLLETEYVSTQNDEPWVVKAVDSGRMSELWMVSKALSNDMLQNIAEIQLRTISKDQGYADDPGQGSSSWFSLGMLQRHPGGVYGPRPAPGLGDQLFFWDSHRNRVGNPNFTICEGKRYHAFEEPLIIMFPSDRLAVWMHAQYPGWENYAKEGKLLYWEYFEPTLLADPDP